MRTRNIWNPASNSPVTQSSIRTRLSESLNNRYAPLMGPPRGRRDSFRDEQAHAVTAFGGWFK
jgi:hypothetical protein